MEKVSWGDEALQVIFVNSSKVMPVVRLRKNSVELLMDKELRRPVLRIGGKMAKEIYAILARRFLVRDLDGCSEVVLPLTALPAVSAWLLASHGSKPSEGLLDKLLSRTPKVIADLIWDLIELSKSSYGDGENRPLIDYRTALRASKVVRGLLELYKVMR